MPKDTEVGAPFGGPHSDKETKIKTYFVLVLFCTAGCTSASSPKSIMTFEERFFGGSLELKNREYASRVTQCMKNNGVDYTPMPLRSSVYRSPQSLRDGGYGLGALNVQNPFGDGFPRLSVADQAVFLKTLGSVNDPKSCQFLGKEFGASLQNFGRAAKKRVALELTDEVIKSIDRTWADCMAGNGVKAQNPVVLLSQVEKRFAESEIGDLSFTKWQADMALVDAKCLEPVFEARRAREIQIEQAILDKEA